MAISPEFRLAAACAIWPPSDRRLAAIRSATCETLDWPRFVRVALRHRVLALVQDGLKRVPSEVPAGIAQEINTRSAQMLRESLAMADEALRLQRLFNEADIPVLFVKGASLAMLSSFLPPPPSSSSPSSSPCCLPPRLAAVFFFFFF